MFNNNDNNNNNDDDDGIVIVHYYIYLIAGMGKIWLPILYDDFWHVLDASITIYILYIPL